MTPARLVMLGTCLALAASALVALTPAQALDRARVGPVDPLQHRFPAYYTDDAGVSLQMCDDGSGRCALARPRDLDGPGGEALYWAAFAELSSPGMDLSVEMALEAAWLGSRQVVFDRFRIRGHVDRAGRYTVAYPYGQLTVTAGDPVEQRNVDFTQDVGCAPAPGRRCRFGRAAGRRGHITTWLRSTARTPGRYLGHPDRFTPVTGGLRQSVQVSGPAGTATTSRFGIIGKRAGANAVSVPRRVGFGNTRGARRHVVRLRNIGTGPMTVRRVLLSGDRTIRRVASTRTCRHGRVLSVGEGCRVAVRYRPDGRRRSAATLTVVDDVRAHKVRLSARTSAVFAAPRRVHFTARRVGTSSRTRRIVVRNTGALPMRIRSIAVRGRSVGSFPRRSGAPRVCAGGARVPAGGTCGLYVAFSPRSFGTKRATVVMRTNALHTHRIRMNGRGR